MRIQNENYKYYLIENKNKEGNKIVDNELHKISVFRCIQHEIVKQRAIWGIQKHDNLKWNAILVEEVGEVSNAINELTPADGKFKYEKDSILANLEYELIQVAAVCCTWIEHLRNKKKGGINESTCQSN